MSFLDQETKKIPYYHHCFKNGYNKQKTVLKDEGFGRFTIKTEISNSYSYEQYVKEFNIKKNNFIDKFKSFLNID